MYPLPVKPDMHPAVSICSSAFLLTLPDPLYQRLILGRNIHSWYKSIISASWYIEKSAHLANGIPIFVTVDRHVFYACLHFLSASERKSRISSFSISNLLIYLSLLDSSYCNCATLLNCWTDGGISFPSFRGHPGPFSPTPESFFRWFRLCRLKKSCIFSYGNPNFFAICRWLNPCPLSSKISFSYILMCRYSLGIKIPPMVAVSLFYHRRGLFVYWPFFTDLCKKRRELYY